MSLSSNQNIDLRKASENIPNNWTNFDLFGKQCPATPPPPPKKFLSEYYDYLEKKWKYSKKSKN